jgi:hypothetical protein
MAALATNIVPIDVGHQPRTRVLSSDSTGSESRKDRVVESSETRVNDFASLRLETDYGQLAHLNQNDLYPARQAFSREHITALRLLKLAIGRCQRAIDAHAEDPMAADSEMQKVQMLLPELFCCRALGDGFGTVVNALICVFQNADGNAFDRTQIEILTTVFQELRDKPFLGVTSADDTVDLLDSNRFSPFPKELIEFLSSRLRKNGLHDLDSLQSQ